MSFISVFYLLFLMTAAGVYYLLPSKYRIVWLLGASYSFYLTWQPAFLLILISVTLGAYFLGRKIAAVTDQPRKKRWLAASVSLLILPLLFFKYYNFLSENLSSVTAIFAPGASLPKQPFLVPLGISFFTFQALSYIVDVYRGYLPPEKRIDKFALYMAFFPTLLAGPIERAKSILSQISNPPAFDYQNIRAGLQLILWGIFKKVVLADRMADFLSKVYKEPQNFQGILIYLAIIFTGLQVFCDFSAYSDIAVGSARILGIRLTKNFDDRVYAAPSREIFWKGWHRSLTAWMRDYVFFPLSGGARAKSRLYLNLIIVYLLVGLWHGATWGFITWGLLNGLWLAGESATKAQRQNLFTRLGIDTNGNLFYFGAWLFIFHVGNFFGVFFRTSDPPEAFAFLKHLTNSNRGLLRNPETFNCLLTIFLLIVMDLINRQIPANNNFDVFISGQKPWFRWALYILLAELILHYFGTFGNTQFVYFNF